MDKDFCNDRTQDIMDSAKGINENSKDNINVKNQLEDQDDKCTSVILGLIQEGTQKFLPKFQ